MAFGFRSVNESSYVQIDADSPRLCVLERGSYGGTNYVANVVFARPVTTQEPPMVFIRPTVTASNELYRTMVLQGSAGNWTGFRMSMMNINYQPTGQWFVATFASRGTDSFGMRLFDASANLIFDTGAYAVAFTSVLQSWTYAGQVQLSVGALYKWIAGRALGADEFFMLNVFSLACQDATAGGTCAVSMDYANNQACMWSNSVSGVWLDQGNRPVVMAKIIAT
jgi:hypothetical protein